MKEYCIYVRQGTGNPYFLSPYNNIIEAKKALFEIIQLEEERQRPYYIDNDFFQNKYVLLNNLKYLCIKERNVEEWQKYSEENTVEENNNKIIFLG